MKHFVYFEMMVLRIHITTILKLNVIKSKLNWVQILSSHGTRSPQGSVGQECNDSPVLVERRDMQKTVFEITHECTKPAECNFRILWICVQWRWSNFTSSATWFDNRSLVSYIVKRSPSISNSIFNLCWIILIVFKSFASPSRAKYSHWIGTITLWDAVRALTVSNPREGGQSMTM